LADPQHPIEQLSLYFDAAAVQVVSKLPVMSQLRRVMLHVPHGADFHPFLSAMVAHKFPNLRRLEISIEGYQDRQPGYLLRQAGSKLENLTAALQGCRIEVVNLLPSECLLELAPQLFRDVDLVQDISIDYLDAVCVSTLNLRLSGLFGVFPVLAAMFPQLDLDEAFVKCYRQSSTLDFLGLVQEMQRGFDDMFNLAGWSKHLPHKFNPPVHWITRQAFRISPFAKKLDPDAYCGDDVSVGPHIKLLGCISRWSLESTNKKHRKTNSVIFQRMVEADPRNFADCIEFLNAPQLSVLFRETSLEWRQKHIDINQTRNGIPFWVELIVRSVHFHLDGRSIVEVLKHPELNVNYRISPSDTSILHELFRICPPMSASPDSEIQEAIRLFLTHPKLDKNPKIPLVAFPTDEGAIRALFADISTLDLFCDVWKSYNDILCSEIYESCQKNPDWIKVFRHIFGLLGQAIKKKDDRRIDELRVEFLMQVWRNALMAMRDADDFERVAAELAANFEIPSFVYDIVHGAAHFPSKIKRIKLRPLLLKLIPRKP
jgi:hypothetical protein